METEGPPSTRPEWFDPKPRFKEPRPPGLENTPVAAEVLKLLKQAFGDQKFTMADLQATPFQEQLEAQRISTSRPTLTQHLLSLRHVGYCESERKTEGPDRRKYYWLVEPETAEE